VEFFLWLRRGAPALDDAELDGTLASAPTGRGDEG
jgi:hypothetical protein